MFIMNKAENKKLKNCLYNARTSKMTLQATTFKKI